jgi:hypothetical protein
MPTGSPGMRDSGDCCRAEPGDPPTGQAGRATSNTKRPIVPMQETIGRVLQERSSSSAMAHHEGRFIWQEVGVLDTYESKALTGTKVMPVFSTS